MSSFNRIVIIIPAFNEQATIGDLVRETRNVLPAADIVVINDGSSDHTAKLAREAGAVVLDLPCNLGVGGAVQAGFKYGERVGASLVIRIDGDGQHPPREIPKLISAALHNQADLIIGSRFLGRQFQITSWIRWLGIKALAFFLTILCRMKVTDPTSGFWAVKKPLIFFFAREYPSDYPEPEAIAILRRQGYSFAEVAAEFRPRLAGKSSIRGWGTLYYAVKVGLALFVDRVRVLNRHWDRSVLVGDARLERR